MVKKVNKKDGDVDTSRILDYKRRKTTSSSRESSKPRGENNKTAKLLVEDIDQQLEETLSDMDKEKEQEVMSSAPKPLSIPAIRNEESES